MSCPFFSTNTTRGDGLFSLKIAAVDENALHECGILCWEVSMRSQPVPIDFTYKCSSMADAA